MGDNPMNTVHLWTTTGAVMPRSSAYVVVLPVVGRVDGIALRLAGSKPRMRRTSFAPSPSGSSAPVSPG